MHNKYGLMGWNGIDAGATADRSEVLPFTVMMLDAAEGWQQYGVYQTEEEAEVDIKKLAVRYGCKVAVADTCVILDLMDASIEPLWDLP